MLNDILTDTLQKIESYRQEHPDDPEDIIYTLVGLEDDIKWLLLSLEKKKFKKSA